MEEEAKITGHRSIKSCHDPYCEGSVADGRSNGFKLDVYLLHLKCTRCLVFVRGSVILVKKYYANQNQTFNQ